MTKKHFYFNGIDALSGKPTFSSITPTELVMSIQLHHEDVTFLEQFKQLPASESPADLTDLGQAGWGVIFSGEADPALKIALNDLLVLRQNQAGNRFRLFDGAMGYQSGETYLEFAARHQADLLPHYLLIVGNPTEIPYRFQQHLNIQHAVGRICFDDFEAYARYAQSVVMTERGQVKLPRQVTFFSVANPYDRATGYSTKYTFHTLHQNLKKKFTNWQINFIARDTTKAKLMPLMGGSQTPAMLITSGHGLTFPSDSPHQTAHQGALLCQDWPGINQHQGEIPPAFYFSSDDLPNKAKLLGSVIFHYGSYGGGTLSEDNQPPFVADLPQKLLSHPQGGVSAIISYAGRVWGGSSPRGGAVNDLFQAILVGLMQGQPVGLALDQFDIQFVELASRLQQEIDQLGKLKTPAQIDEYLKQHAETIVNLWSDYNDLQNYVIVGDPAVRLPVVEAGGPVDSRPVLELEPPVEQFEDSSITHSLKTVLQDTPVEDVSFALSSVEQFEDSSITHSLKTVLQDTPVESDDEYIIIEKPVTVGDILDGKIRRFRLKRDEMSEVN